ncbi:aspartate-beta-hydroxylase [Cricetulus griseus]
MPAPSRWSQNTNARESPAGFHVCHVPEDQGRLKSHMPLGLCKCCAAPYLLRTAEGWRTYRPAPCQRSSPLARIAILQICGSSSSPGARREGKHGGHKNGRRGGISGGSFFTWFMVIALLGVWTSVAVVWFDLVDYEEVLGLKERSTSERSFPAEEAKPPAELEEQASDFGTEVNVPSVEEQQDTPPVKKKKPKLLNKFDKTIKAELDAAEKLRKRCEDDLAEKRRSNEVLRRAIETYQEAASLPDAPTELVKLSLKRRSERQQFLGHMRGSLLTLQRLVQLFPSDTTLKNDLGVGYLLMGDNDSAKKVYEEVLNVTPNDGFAKVHYGFILKAQNKIAESIPYLKEGIESGDPGTDDGRFYFHLGDAMQRVGNKEAYKWYELGHKRGHFASVWQRSLYNVNGLKAQPWWTPRETGYTELVKSLERNWKLIRDEGLMVMDKAKGLFLPEDENLREKGDWSQFTLWQQGRKNENACKGAPKTCTLLEKFSETTGCRRGQIKYSIMHPGTHVWPHTGPTNCRLRMHLGLVIPKEGCKIRCANETRTWEEGKVLIFDDSFEHEVWQDASSFRLIFIVDVWHPELTPQQRRSLPAI